MRLNTLSLSLHMQTSQPSQQQSTPPLLLLCYQLCTLFIPSPHTGIINPSRRLTRIVHISLMPTDLQIWNIKDKVTDHSSRLILQQTAQIPISLYHDYEPVPSRAPSFSPATLNMLLHKNCSSSQSQVGSRGRGAAMQCNVENFSFLQVTPNSSWKGRRHSGAIPTVWLQCFIQWTSFTP